MKLKTQVSTQVATLNKSAKRSFEKNIKPTLTKFAATKQGKFAIKNKWYIAGGFGAAIIAYNLLAAKTLVLNRSYHKSATTGTLRNGFFKVCDTMELAWNDNKRMISCIPEGTYELKMYLRRSGVWALEVKNVPNRTVILIHKGVDATPDENGADTLGCILCVTEINEYFGNYQGINTTDATQKLYDLVFPILRAGKKVFLKIK
jgi:hypothetical protein